MNNSIENIFKSLQVYNKINEKKNIFDDYYDGGCPYGCGRAEE